MLASKIKEIKNGRVITKDKKTKDAKTTTVNMWGDNYEVEIIDGTHLKMRVVGTQGWGTALHFNQVYPEFLEALKAKGLVRGNFFVEDSKDKLTLDPLTKKGEEILSNMKEQYGAEKGEQVFYASKNKGTISGVDSKTGDDWSPEARQKALEARRRNAKGGQRQEPSEKRKRLVKALSDPWNEKKDPDRNTREEHIKGLRSWRSDMEKAREAGNTKLANQILKNIQTQSRKHGIQAHEIYKDSKPIKRISAYSSKDEDDIFKKRQIEIAKKTLRMPDAMVGVIGGMTKEEAKEILKKYGVSESEDEKEPIDPTNPKNIASAKTKAVAGGQAAVTSSGKMKDANGDFNQYLQDVINYMMGKGLSPDTAWMASKYGREEIKTYFDRGASVKEAGDIIFARQTR